ncbi:MAG TPA: hypothetical protein VH054_07355 [Polyangiaceae bacterium]|jgi:hypothetical protein|nr:hypothetical protein [Polyangiaceae bacterium]
MRFRKLFVLSAFAFASACSSTPTNFAGTYTLSTTQNADDCNLGSASWTPGSTTNFTGTFTQDGTAAQITVTGGAAVVLNVVVGTDTFQGSVSGNTFTSELIGTKKQTDGACSWSTNIAISASLDSNSVLSGTITLTPITNGDPSCGAKNSCANTETVSGNRTGP